MKHVDVDSHSGACETQVTARLRELHTTNEAGERRRDATLQEIAAGLEEWSSNVRGGACVGVAATGVCC
jgi:hypothetical protein